MSKLEFDYEKQVELENGRHEKRKKTLSFTDGLVREINEVLVFDGWDIDVYDSGGQIAISKIDAQMAEVRTIISMVEKITGRAAINPRSSSGNNDVWAHADIFVAGVGISILSKIDITSCRVESTEEMVTKLKLSPECFNPTGQ